MQIQASFLRERLRLTLEQNREYVAEMMSLLHEALAQETKAIAEQFETDDFLDDIAMDLQDIEHRYSSVFATTLIQSFILALFSQLEHFLHRLVGLHRSTHSHPLRLNDFRGDLFARLDLYLVSASLTRSTRGCRQRLNTLTLVRNCVAHNAGRITGTPKEHALRNLIKGHSGLGLGPHDRLEISPAYCDDSIDLIGSFLRDLFGKLGLDE